MTLTKNITDILNGTIESVKAILPFDITIEKPTLFSQPFSQQGIGVLIGMTGDIRGRVIIDGEKELFGKISEAMFGMFLEGEMLESFAGEFGNMLAGHLSTNMSQRGFEMDITPPTVLVGQTKLFGFNRAVRLPIEIADHGLMDIVLAVESD